MKPADAAIEALAWAAGLLLLIPLILMLAEIVARFVATY